MGNFPRRGTAADVLHTLTGLALSMLVVLGIGGTIYRLMAPGGWMARLFAESPALGATMVLAATFVGMLAWLGSGRASAGQRDRLSGLFVYGSAGVGAFYSVQFLLLRAL